MKDDDKKPGKPNGKTGPSEDDIQVLAETAFPKEQRPPARSNLRMETDLHAHAAERPQKAGDIRPVEADQRALEDNARAMARERGAQPYDPIRHHGDRLRDEHFRRGLETWTETETQAAHAQRRLRESEIEDARSAVDEPAPRASFGEVLAGTMLIAASIAPTIADNFLVVVFTAVMAWIIAAAIATGAGYFIIRSIADPMEERPGETNRAYWGGIVVGLGLAAIRLSSASSGLEIAAACGLSAIEIGAVLILEGRARTRRARFTEWLARKRKQTSAQRCLGVAERDAQRADMFHREAEDVYEAHVEYIEDRDERARNGDVREESAVGASRDGYSHGIARARGRVRGVEETEE